jgi:type III secretory pathway component EscS
MEELTRTLVILLILCLYLLDIITVIGIMVCIQELTQDYQEIIVSEVSYKGIE